MGFTVFRFTYQDVVYDWPRVERQIRAAIAQGLTG
jgi:very-short-patch-repair endonuclease